MSLFTRHSPLLPKRALQELTDRDTSFHSPIAQDQARDIAKGWLEAIRESRISKRKETAYYREFVNDFFFKILGYRGAREVGAGTAWTMMMTTGLGGGSGSIPDLTLGVFHKPDDHPAGQVPVELKAVSVPLDRTYGGRDSAVMQMLRYVVQSGGDWAIASNMEEFRLYHRQAGIDRYHSWTLEELAGKNGAIRTFHACLSPAHLIQRDATGQTELDRAWAGIGPEQERVTREFYKDYKGVREAIFRTLGHLNPTLDSAAVLSRTQLLLDRLLFICFAEDRGLMRPHILDARLTKDLPPGKGPKLRNLRELFVGINEGWEYLDIPAYNGGLFRTDPLLDEAMTIPEEVADWALLLAKRDFYDEVSVDVLGHVFEQSITDLAVLRGEDPAKKSGRNSSKRKTEGVFYTPQLVTTYIVDQTVGRLVRDIVAELTAPWRDLDPPRLLESREEIAILLAARERMSKLRIVDPACGSGAFLLAAYAYLKNQYELIASRLYTLKSESSEFGSAEVILSNNLFGVDLNSESVEITRLSLWIATADRERPLVDLDATVKQGNSLTGFHWETAFPAVFEDGGFDCVIGNPPYVRQERIKEMKPALEQRYACYDPAADLYTYFYELGLRLLKPSGRLGYISGGSFFRGGFGVPLRKHLREQSQVEQILNFGDYRVFPDAEMVDPSIVILSNPAAVAPMPTRVWVNHQKKNLPSDGIADILSSAGFDVPREALGDQQWQLAPTSNRLLADKLFERGTPLGEIAGGQIYRGVLTGLNRTEGTKGEGVFVVDQAKRDTLVREDPKSKAVLKSLLEGKDIRPWHLESQGLWLVRIENGWTRAKAKSVDVLTEAEGWKLVVRHLPAIAKHLLPFADRARARSDQGEFWWELRPCDYYDAFEQPKIIWPDIAKTPRFYRDDQHKYTTNTGYLLTKADWSLVGLLNSAALWLALCSITQPLGQRAGLFRYRLFRQYIERLPIPTLKAREERVIADCAQELSKLAASRHAIVANVRHRLYSDQLKQTVPGPRSNKIDAWHAQDFATLRKEVKRLTKKDIPFNERTSLEQSLAQERRSVLNLAADMSRLEVQLNAAVNKAFGLTPEECARVDRVLQPVGLASDDSED